MWRRYVIAGRRLCPSKLITGELPCFANLQFSSGPSLRQICCGCHSAAPRISATRCRRQLASQFARTLGLPSGRPYELCPIGPPAIRLQPATEGIPMAADYLLTPEGSPKSKCGRWTEFDGRTDCSGFDTNPRRKRGTRKHLSSLTVGLVSRTLSRICLAGSAPRRPPPRLGRVGTPNSRQFGQISPLAETLAKIAVLRLAASSPASIRGVESRDLTQS
jgi:hypothetical protein